MTRWCWSMILMVGAVAGGCGRREDPQAIPGDAFFRRQPAIHDTISNPVDRPGAVQYDNVRVENLGADVGQGTGAPVREVPEVVQQAVQPVGTPTTGQPVDGNGATIQASTAPTTQTLQPGGYMIVGFVLAQVRERPIFAEQVLTAIDAPLRAEAKRSDPETFRRQARELIIAEIRKHINDELEVAAAEAQLTAQEKELAELATMQWKRRQITEAGGSEALAAQKWTEQGETFEQRLAREHRTNLIRVYMTKKVYTRIQPSAADLRDYYQRNLDKEFTQLGEAKFVLLRVDPVTAEAREFAQTLVHRARQGEPFDQLADEQPPTGVTLKQQPLPGAIQKGAFRYEKVEQAVWAAQPGTVTEPVEDSGSLFVARVESLQPGQVRPFSDPAVQTEIKNKITSIELQRYRGMNLERLRANAIVVEPTNERVEAAVDMAMQGYRTWRVAGA